MKKRTVSQTDLSGDARPAKQATGGSHSSTELFDGLGREAYLARHVHKKLHTQATGLSDDDLHVLGKLTFNEQFQRFEPLANTEMIANGDIFGGISRDEYLQGRVHRRLHARVSNLADMELLELGKMSFNQQFQYFGEGPPPSAGSSSMPSAQQHAGGSLFGSLSRSQYVQQRIHRKWHSQAAHLSDEELAEVGKLSFNEQFPIFEQIVHDSAGVSQQPAVDFGIVGREGYMTTRIHRKLHSVAACLSDRDLLELGRLSFNDQFPTIESLLPGVQVDAAPGGDPSTAGMQRQPGANINFGPSGREGYMQQRVHRKLHVHAATLSDDDLFELGKLSFNEQFPFLGVDERQGAAHGSQPEGLANDVFNGLSKDAYMKQRVHRRLHHLAVALSDQGLFDLGQLKFNEQFPVLGQDLGDIDAAPDDAKPQETLLFDGMPKEAYIEKHVHRKLHSHAMGLPDEDLHTLGKLSFNEQFPLLGVEDEKGAGKGGAGKKGKGKSDRRETSAFTDEADRQGYIERRVHRKMHGHVARFSDQELLDFGRRSFNEQFDSVGLSMNPSFGKGTKSDRPHDDSFGGLSRDQYMQQRVHRKLHVKGAALNDNELLELGRLSFNDQFPFLEQFTELCSSEGGGLESQNDVFEGQGREGYMTARIHRRLHPQCANLSDQDVMELGKLNFNGQFPALQNMLAAPGGEAEQDESDAFGGAGREAFMTARVHRRLHAQAAGLPDDELSELGKQSFNQQFVTLGHAAL